MTYDTAAIKELTRKIERFELPRAYSVSMEDFVVSREKGHGWFPCQYCGSVIERTLQYANRKFTCLSCKTTRQHEYDNRPDRIARRKETRK